jgi:hypothetical protein
MHFVQCNRIFTQKARVRKVRQEAKWLQRITRFVQNDQNVITRLCMSLTYQTLNIIPDKCTYVCTPYALRLHHTTVCSKHGCSYRWCILSGVFTANKLNLKLDETRSHE